MTIDTIPAALRAAASRFGDEEALVDGGERVTSAGLLERSLEAARAFVATGVGPGDRVAIWAPNSATWITASFGVYLAGAVLVPRAVTQIEGNIEAGRCHAGGPVRLGTG